jgi:ATP-dependent DNA ligase
MPVCKPAREKDLAVAESITAAKMEQCRWVKPKLVCQVAFLEWTDAGHLRHCTFVAMRDDKKPAEVVRET